MEKTIGRKLIAERAGVSMRTVTRVLQGDKLVAEQTRLRVLEVVDEQIPANNARWLITCQDGEKTIVEANRDWDIQLPIAVLTRIVYGTQTFADFLECNAGYDMRMRSPAMDGMFGHHLTIDGGEK